MARRRQRFASSVAVQSLDQVEKALRDLSEGFKNAGMVIDYIAARRVGEQLVIGAAGFTAERDR